MFVLIFSTTLLEIFLILRRIQQDIIMNFMFKWPCIVKIFVYITNKMHQVSQILFCHETLHVSGIFCAHHQELSAAHVAIGMFHAEDARNM
jgi:hypothetical protein